MLHLCCLSLLQLEFNKQNCGRLLLHVINYLIQETRDMGGPGEIQDRRIQAWDMLGTIDTAYGSALGTLTIPSPCFQSSGT